MPEKYESREYSSSFTTGRLQFIAYHRVWTEYRLHDWQLMYTFSGQGRLIGAGSAFDSGVGDLHLFSPHTRRSYEPAGRPFTWEHLWVHFQPPASWAPLLLWPVLEPGIRHLHLSTPELRKKVMADLSEMHQVGSSRAHYQEQLAVNLLKTALLRCQSVNPRIQKSAIDPRVQRAMDLLSENLSRAFEARTICQDCGLSERQFFRLFRRATGHSPRDYHEICRLESAARLLRESRFSIGEIAGQLGYENPFYFTLRFKRRTGLSPRAFRLKHRLSALADRSAFVKP